MSSGPRLTDNGFLLVAALLGLDSLHFVFAKLLFSHISPRVSAMYVLGIAAVEVGLLGLSHRRLSLRTMGQHLWFFLVIGFLVGASTYVSFEAMAFVDAGTASLLAKTSILFGLCFGLFWLQETFTPAQMVGALIALAGVFVITFQPADYLRIGSLMMLGSAFMYALHAAVVKRYGDEITFLDFFFYRLLFSTVFLLLFALGRRALIWPSGQVWLLLILTGTIDVVVSRALYYVALRRLRMSIHSVVLALSPVATVLWSLLLFGTMLAVQQFLGGIVVILGVLIVTLNQAHQIPSPDGASKTEPAG